MNKPSHPWIKPGIGLTKPQIIAIHGVGIQSKKEIKKSIEKVLPAEVTLFNWDELVDYSAGNSREAYSLLSLLSRNVTSTASLPLPSVARLLSAPRRTLAAMHIWLYAFAHVFIAFSLAALILTPMIYFITILPASYFEGLQWAKFAWIKIPLNYFFKAGGLVILLLLVFGLLRSLAGLWIRPFLVTLRRIGLLIFLPAILLNAIPFVTRWPIAILRILWMGAFLLVGLCISFVISIITGQAFEAGQIILVILICILTVLTIVALWKLLRKPLIRGPIKITLDIVRYLGSPEYRRKLLDAFDKKVTKVFAKPGQERRITLFAHSLGSVIAVDSLVNSQIWKKGDKVDLITVGSPLRRFFFRFFPNILFPASSHRLGKTISKRIGEFRWLNIYRPLDYVGTNLRLRKNNIGIDISTRQYGKLFSSHSNYWADDVVLNCILDAPSRIPDITKPSVPIERPSYLIPKSEDAPRSFHFLARKVEVAAKLIVLAVVVLSVVSFVTARKNWVEHIEDSALRLQKEGVESTAAITHHRTTESFKESTFYLHHFEFAFLVDGSIERFQKPIVHGEALNEDVLRFDYRGLAKFIREEGELLQKKLWWQFWKRKISIPCVRKGIRIIFDQEDPASFILPNFPPKITKGDRIKELFGGLLFLIFYMVLTGFVVIGGGVPLFRLFLGLGREVEEEKQVIG